MLQPVEKPFPDSAFSDRFPFDLCTKETHSRYPQVPLGTYFFLDATGGGQARMVEADFSYYTYNLLHLLWPCPIGQKMTYRAIFYDGVNGYP